MGTSFAEPHPTNTGYRATLTASGMEKYVQTLVNEITEGMHNIPIPDIHGFQSVGIGNISYSLTDVILVNMAIPKFETDLAGGRGYTVLFEGCTTRCTFSWRYKDQDFPYTGDRGTGDTTLSELNMNLMATIQASEEGGPLLKVLQTSINIGKMDINLKGGAAWLYDFMIKLFKGSVKKVLEDTLEDKLSSVIEDIANNRFKDLPNYNPLDDLVAFDERLTKNTVFTDKYFSMMIYGEVVPQKDHTMHYPGPPAKKLPTVVNDREIQVFFDEFVVNSDIYAHWMQNYFDITLDQDQVPSTTFDFRTTSFEKVLPALYSLCKDCPLRMVFTVPKMPLFQIMPGNGYTNATAQVAVQAIDPSGVPVNAFKFSLTLGLITSPYCLTTADDSRISWSFDLYDESTALLETEIGDIDLDSLGKFLRALIGYGILPFTNAWGAAAGVKMPWLIGLEYMNPTAMVADDTMGIFADLKVRAAN